MLKKELVAVVVVLFLGISIIPNVIGGNASFILIVSSDTPAINNIIYVDDVAEGYWGTLTVSMPMQNNIINEQDNNINISIQGGLGIKIEICNYGNTTLFFVNWSITIDGPLVFLGRSNSGYISEIPPGECATIETLFIMGIGPINITIEIGDAILSINGYLIGPFLLI